MGIATPTTADALEPIVIEAGELFRLQLLVARRADALARRYRPATPQANRRLWLRAELETYDAHDAQGEKRETPDGDF